MILSLVSKKGGVGKTTTAVNLSAALADRGHRVLLIDLDPQGSTSLSLGIPRAQFAPSVAELVLGNRGAHELVRGTVVPNLDLITSSTDLAHADQDLAGLAQRERRLRDKLEPIRDAYDFVLLDCPPSLSLLPASALVASDAYIVPTQPHFLALEGLANLHAAIDRLGQRHGSRSRLLGILLTMVDYRTRLTRGNVSSIRETFGNDVFAIEIRSNVRLAEAPGFGKTIFDYDAECAGAEAYRLLAEELLLRARALRGDELPATAAALPRADAGLRARVEELAAVPAEGPEAESTEPDQDQVAAFGWYPVSLTTN